MKDSDLNQIIYTILDHQSELFAPLSIGLLCSPAAILWTPAVIGLFLLAYPADEQGKGVLLLASMVINHGGHQTLTEQGLKERPCGGISDIKPIINEEPDIGVLATPGPLKMPWIT